MDSLIDNTYEWFTGDNVAIVTFSQKKWINKMRKYAEEYPEEVQIVVENEDGSIVGRVPVTWFKMSPPRKGREFTEEEKAATAERLALARKKKQDD